MKYLPRNLKICLALAIFFIINFTNKSLSQDTLHFSTIGGSIHIDIGLEILKKAYSDIGYEIKKSVMQGKTGLRNADEFDGELLRIDGISRDYPHLVQVPIPVTFFQGVVFSSKYYFPVKSWYSLETYKIGIVKGAFYAELGTQGMNVVRAENAEELFQMLDRHEIDVGVVSKLVGQLYLKTYPEIRELDGILETMFLYHYLHEKNEKLLPEIEVVLKNLLLDGTSRRMRQQISRSLNLRRVRDGNNRQ